MSKPLFTESLRVAKFLDAVTDYSESKRENIVCKNAIEVALRERFNGFTLDDDCARDLCEQFGVERVGWVLANTIQHKTWDGRFREHNKQWAEKYTIPTDPEDYTTDYCVNSHSEIVNGLIDQYHSYVQNLDILDFTACVKGSVHDDYTEKLLILKPSALSEKYRSSEFQYFFAEAGFGCDPKATGTKVFGRFLSDGEETQFRRGDFLGIADESLLPDWALEKLKELTIVCEESQGMGGIQ